MIQFRDVAWRAMSGYDFDAVFTIANKVHPGFFERSEVLAEKFALYRQGCYLLEVGEKPAGYVLSHPWLLGQVPPLDTLLEQLPPEADTFYIHDLALLPLTRGLGAAGKIVDGLTKHADAMGYQSLSLVAVNNSVAFWEKQGFEGRDLPGIAETLSGYEAGARYMVKPRP
jgi:ribosomal protein S18 acetylase RimI-like enzyme